MNIVRWLFPFAHGLGLGVLAMLLHECGHLLMAFFLGLQVKNIGMKWNKGLYTVRQQGTPLQNLLVAASGPFINVLLIPAGSWVPLFGLANLCYALANILPIEGSDGYRIAICWRQLRTHSVPEGSHRAPCDVPPGPSTTSGSASCAPRHPS